VSILVFAEHDGSQLDKSGLGLLSRAAGLGAGEVSAVLCGGGPLDALAAEAGRYGAARVYLAQDEALDAPLPQPRVDALADLVRSGPYDTVLLSNSVLTADVAAGLAARLNAGLNWDLTGIDWRDGTPVGTRPALQDSVLIEVGWRSPIRLGLFRPGSFDAAPVGSAEPVIEKVAVRVEEHSRAVRLLSRQVVAETEGPSVEGADVVVAGGMGLGAPEGFTLAEQLAAAVGGVVGATRAAVYAGWYPRAAQIGQTGKKVSPKLYIGLGVSGAVQHRVGMQTSKVIVAINKDPAAPIFECSDLAVVGDVHTIVPRLIEIIEQRMGR
jgi:electron transfer flavoprotein alpha subunit